MTTLYFARKRNYLTTSQLALRWNMSPDKLRNWRKYGLGPKSIKLGRTHHSTVIYHLNDVREYEAKHNMKEKKDGDNKDNG